MKYLPILFKGDLVLLYRNQLFSISMVIALLYTGLFYLLKPLGNLSNLAIVLIFNDPVVTGYLFAGVLWLFDRNQHTLQAISVLPVRLEWYLFSKALVLSLLATLVAVIMTVAMKGWAFNPVHLILSTFLSAFLFSSFGFAIGALSKNFNQFLMYSIPFFIVAGLPLLPLFGIGRFVHFLLIPVTGGVAVMQAAFNEGTGLAVWSFYFHLLLWSAIGWWLAVKNAKRALL